MSRSRRFLPAAPILLCAVVLVSCGHRAPRQATAVTVGVPALEQNALLYVAKAERLFAPNGITVTVRTFSSGPAAIAAMRRGTVDIAETAEFPFAESVMDGERLRIVAANDRFENDYLVARKDRGISTISDLRGKRIGVSRKAITEFYLSRFLTLNGIPSRDIIEVDVPPADFVQSIVEGKVDAIVAWQPFVSRMIAANPKDFNVWSVQSSQAVYGLLVCRAAWLEDHAGAAKRFLKSLAEGQDFLVRHPAEAQTIVARDLKDSNAYISTVWPDHEFSLTLDFSLVAAMEDEARWLIANHLTKATQVPDFVRYISFDGLEAVRPNGVDVMR